MNNNFINELKWEGNSLKMYNAIIKAVPFMFVNTVNNSIKNWIIKNNIKVVTEDIVFQAVDEISPANLANRRIKPELMKLRTK